MIAATNGWVINLDNLSELPPWLSDALCRLSTGGGFATRELYTDDGETIFDAQRPVILNGIEEIVSRSDLLNRALFLRLPEILENKRQDERQLWTEFEAARPRLLAALCDALSLALCREPDVVLARLPRMADFARWIVAAGPALGDPDGGRFLVAYARNRAETGELALEALPVAAVIRDLADQVGVNGYWAGTATELLVELSERLPEARRKGQPWPKDARAMRGVLNRLAPDLRKAGASVEFQDQRDLGRRRRQVIVQKMRGDHCSDGSGAGAQRGNRSSERSSRNDARNGRGSETARRNDGNGGGTGFSGELTWPCSCGAVNRAADKVCEACGGGPATEPASGEEPAPRAPGRG